MARTAHNNHGILARDSADRPYRNDHQQHAHGPCRGGGGGGGGEGGSHKTIWAQLLGSGLNLTNS